MSPELDKTIRDIESATGYLPLAEGGERGIAQAKLVQSQDGTTRYDPGLTPNTGNARLFEDYSSRVDSLFGDKAPYLAIKREKPEHRLMLWYRLEGFSPQEIAKLTGYTVQSVYLICRQPWFRDAFVRLSTEAGKDAVQTYLAGEVLPAVQRVVHMAENANQEAVKLAANREILDRFLGKATVRVETKTEVTTDRALTDLQTLQEERRRVDEQLRANGLLPGNHVAA